MRLGSTINCSVIPADESDAFLDRFERDELFGSTMKPDVVRISSVKKLPRQQQAQGQDKASAQAAYAQRQALEAQ